MILLEQLSHLNITNLTKYFDIGEVIELPTSISTENWTIYKSQLFYVMSLQIKLDKPQIEEYKLTLSNKYALTQFLQMVREFYLKVQAILKSEKK